jgi:hypothetical protein
MHRQQIGRISLLGNFRFIPPPVFPSTSIYVIEKIAVTQAQTDEFVKPLLRRKESRRISQMPLPKTTRYIPGFFQNLCNSDRIKRQPGIIIANTRYRPIELCPESLLVQTR